MSTLDERFSLLPSDGKSDAGLISQTVSQTVGQFTAIELSRLVLEVDVGTGPEVQGDHLVIWRQFGTQILKRFPVKFVKGIACGASVVGQNGDLVSGVGFFHSVEDDIQILIDVGKAFSPAPKE